jgi:hypothetical protein
MAKEAAERGALYGVTANGQPKTQLKRPQAPHAAFWLVTIRYPQVPIFA